ncbi:MAG: dTDP-4-dehydrorhamnose reductase [Gammaproteobacteria bacterium]
MKIIVTGANGQIGNEIQRQKFPMEIELIALTHPSFDITNSKDVIKIFKHYQPNLIINTAAYTAVDQAEENPVQASLVNTEGVLQLAKACSDADIPLIHLSTDYVFNGKNQLPYTELDKTEPLGIYGQSKWQGEEAIRYHLKNHIILRTSWVFGYFGNNFVKTILKLAQQNPILRIVSDQVGCPTSAKDIAITIWEMVGKLNQFDDSIWGTYHYAGTPALSWYDFAKTILNYASLNKEVMPIKTEDYPTLAKRPAYSVLNCQKIKNIFGISQPKWEIELFNLTKELL